MPRLKKNSQSAIEFIIVLGMAMFFFTLFLAAIYESSSIKSRENKMLILGDIASVVRDEISLAYSSSEGYSRNFSLPEKAGNFEYEINITASSVYIVSDKDALALGILNVTGEIKKGENIISKTSGGVFIN